MGSSYRQLLLIMGGGVLFYTKKHEELGQRKKSSFEGCPRTSCVFDMGYWKVPQVCLCSSWWKSNLICKGFTKNRLAIVFLANVEHTWRRAVVFHLLMSVVRGGVVATKRSKSYSLLFCPFSLWQKVSLVNIWWNHLVLITNTSFKPGFPWTLDWDKSG